MIRSLIREFLLQEEVFGAQAFVYHGSQAPPDVLLPIFLQDKFTPGAGSGAMYGKGLYAVYDLAGSKTESGSTYGQYIYKLKVNLYGFISFDQDVTRKIYKKDLTPSQQAQLVGADKDTIKNLKQFDGKEAPQVSSDWADSASRYLRGKVKGLVYTGRQDGRCIVLYDVSVAVPIAWKKVKNKKWKKISKEEIKPALKRSAMDSWEKEKYDASIKSILAKISKLPVEDRVFKGKLEINAASNVRFLPEGLRVKGNLEIWDSQITSLPDGLRVEGDVNLISPCLISSIGSRTIIEGDFRCDGCKLIKTLPNDIYVGKTMSMRYSGVEFLPENLNVGSLDLEDSQKITNLPSKVYHGIKTLSISNTNISEIPQSFEVSNEIYADSCYKLVKLPDNLKLQRLSIDDCPRLRSLPSNFDIDVITMQNSRITKIPNNVKFKQIYGFAGNMDDIDIHLRPKFR